MKKIIKIGLISIFVVVIAVGVWLIGYHTGKSQDNLPALAAIAGMDEAGVNELLVGYRNYQLDDVWGEPDVKTENTWIWKIDEYTQVQVSFNDKDKIVVCGIGSVFRAKILEIGEGSYLVEPVEGSPELKSSDQITVPITHLDSSLEPEVGEVIEIFYNGEIMETYPARLAEISHIRIAAESEDEQWALIPMVMVDGRLYFDTGMESSVDGRCGVMDGEITSSVDGTQKPTQDGESNFGTGYEYQYGSQEGTIEIFMNEKWWIFATEEVRQEIQFPEKSID